MVTSTRNIEECGLKRALAARLTALERMAVEIKATAAGVPAQGSLRVMLLGWLDCLNDALSAFAALSASPQPLTCHWCKHPESEQDIISAAHAWKDAKQVLDAFYCEAPVGPDISVRVEWSRREEQFSRVLSDAEAVLILSLASSVDRGGVAHDDGS